MQLVSIVQGRATVVLDPMDCLRLARACVAASCACAGDTDAHTAFGFPLAGTHTDLTLAALYEALGLAFEAGAMATAADAYLVGERDTFTLAEVQRQYGDTPRPEGAAQR